MFRLRRFTTAVNVALLMFVAASVRAQSSERTPPSELKKWDVWIGDWALSGSAKDAPSTPEYKVDWSLHERWILGGFFVQVEQAWKANGQELHSLEILGYDPAQKIHTVSGFSSDGTTWSLTATLDAATTREDGKSIDPNGQATTCHTTWTFSDDGKALSGTQECEQSGARWIAFQVKGTRTSR